jgi:hypothetical protein
MRIHALCFGGVLLFVGALFVAAFPPPRQTLAAKPSAENQERDEIAELKKRIAKLEAEVAQLRKGLLAAGGLVDKDTDVKNVREVVKARCADLLQRVQNTHAILRDITNGKLQGQALNNRINDFNNDLGSLWFTMAAYGLGRDPYLDNIQVSDSGFGSAKPAPDFGVPGPYVGIGLPRLHERFLEASGAKGKAADQAGLDFKKLVQPYSNPAVFDHRGFGERAYNDYRNGKGLLTAQYTADLMALDQWLTNLESAIAKVPAYFDKVP